MKTLICTLLFVAALSPSAFAQAPGDDPQLDSLQVQWYPIQASIQVLQGTPGVTPDTMEPTFHLFETWMVQALAYPQLMPFILIGEQGFITAVSNSATFDRSQCVAANDPKQITKIQALINWATSKPELAPYLGTSLASIQEQLEKCAHFDIQITSQMSVHGQVTVNVKAQFPLTVIAQNNQLIFSGSGTLSHGDIIWPQMPGCTLTPVGDAQNISVSSGSVQMLATPFSVDFADLKFALSVPAMTETITAVCAQTVSFSQHNWSDGWRANHMYDESHTDLSVYDIKDWDLSQTRVFASRVYQQGTAIQENTTIILIHTPQ